MALNLSRQAIRDELDADPAGLGYATMTDAEVAQAMMTVRIIATEQRSISHADILDRAPPEKYLALMAADRAGTSHAATLFIEYLHYQGAIETAEGTRGREVLEALVADGLLTAQEAQAFLSWGEVNTLAMRAHEVWGASTGIVEQDIADARAL